MGIFKSGDKVLFGGEEWKVMCYINGYKKDEQRIVAIEGEYLTADVSEDYLLNLNPQYNK